MKHIQFHTDHHYLCFRHAVELALVWVDYSKGDYPIWAETLPKGGPVKCIRCARRDIDRDPEGHTYIGDFLIEQAVK